MPRKTVKAAAVVRDTKGRIVSGSLNPGGVPKAALELRKLALGNAERALERARELMENENPVAANFGITHILNRSLGKDGSAADLPDDEVELPDEIPTSPAELHTLAMRGLARSLLLLEKQRILSPAQIELQAEAAKALSTLLGEERELVKSGPGGNLSDEKLLEEILGSVPLDRLKSVLVKRLRAPEAKKR